MNNEAYAKYLAMPELSYNILEYLIKSDDAEIIWKLLKYNDSDAWTNNNLTIDEKRSLIYPGGEHSEKYNIFFDFVMDDASDRETTYLRIYPSKVYPQNRTIGICAISFEVFTHSKINHLSNYQTRIDNIITALINSLNGKDVGGVGVMYFDASRSAEDNIQLLGFKPYKGKVLTMSVNMG